jgi:hypothetical protein
MNGWPPGATFDQTITLDTVDERIEISPFTGPDWRMTFEAGTDTVGNTDTRRTTRCGPASGTRLVQRATCDQMFRPGSDQ